MKEKLIGLGTFGVGIAAILLTLAIPVVTVSEDPGPRLFPLVGGVLMLVSGAGIFLQALAGKGSASGEFLSADGRKRAAGIFGLMALYALALFVFGFLVSTLFFVFLFVRIIARDKKIPSLYNAIYSIIVVALIWVTFEKGLNSLLPTGILF